MSKMVNQAENENISKDFFLKLSKWLPYLFGFIILILALAYARIKMQEPDSSISKLFITNKPNSILKLYSNVFFKNNLLFYSSRHVL
jgi:hypothetical protein